MKPVKMAHQRKPHRIDKLIVALTTVDIPVVSGVIVLAGAIVLPIMAVMKHRQAKRLLITVWQLADHLGFSAADLKRLSGSFDYGVIDWALTRPGRTQTIVPSLETICLVRAELKRSVNRCDTD
ncbi:hypothetical protein ACFQ5J_10610 [Lacticaseibacillus baoqingensis]|uniref:Uncharacterized protein n=1 Tax=Lacticaseibacillus baoqingensis TaxID=2486013 RepID=A0ABW4EAG4_9LACO|nr:hypothetical protein [Lacticaseibacillus baoqingensis]